MKLDIEFWDGPDGHRAGLNVSLYPFRGRLTSIEIRTDRNNRTGRWREPKLHVSKLGWELTPQQSCRLALATMIALKLVPLIATDSEGVTKKNIMEQSRHHELCLTIDNPFLR